MNRITTRLTQEESTCTGSCGLPYDVVGFCADCVDQKWLSECFFRNRGCEVGVFDRRIPGSSTYACCSMHEPTEPLELIVHLFEDSNDTEPRITSTVVDVPNHVSPLQAMLSLVQKQTIGVAWGLGCLVQEWANKQRKFTTLVQQTRIYKQAMAESSTVTVRQLFQTLLSVFEASDPVSNFIENFTYKRYNPIGSVVACMPPPLSLLFLKNTQFEA